ncbi:hypothetical protein ACNF49_25145 [Actinomadura sp. ATCC 39365]
MPMSESRKDATRITRTELEHANLNRYYKWYFDDVDAPEFTGQHPVAAYRDPHALQGTIDRLAGLAQDFTCYQSASKRQLEAHRKAYRAEIIRQMETHYDMAPMSSWSALIHRIKNRAKASADGSVLVSLVFCHPNSLVFRDLKESYTYLNLRSGTTWDLNFLGYHTSRIKLSTRPSILGVPQWRFDARDFIGLTAAVEERHRTTLTASCKVQNRSPWQFSGTADLVSFMAYRDFPGLIDWPSLQSVTLLDAQGAYADRSLAQIVEILCDWREDEPELRNLAPGEVHQTGVSVLGLRSALTASAAVIAGGIAGNTAYDLLKQIIS